MTEKESDLKFKVAPPHEGKCDICKKVFKDIRSFGNIETKRVVSICVKCSQKVQDDGINDIASLIEKHGKINEGMFTGGMKYLGKGAAG
jgi:hypothetical protein